MVVLNWKYKIGSDKVLDAINTGSFNDLEELSKIIGISLSGLKKRISKLKKDGLLVIHRYQNNNFIYMIGDDVKNNWSKSDAVHIAIHRDLIPGSSKEDLTDGFNYKDIFKGKSLEFTDEEKKEMDIIVDELINSF
jgi:hypothetical protein